MKHLWLHIATFGVMKKNYSSKNFLILGICIMTILGLKAQPVITSQHMPSSGDTLRYSLAGINGVDALESSTGASQTWDFSGLTLNRQDVASYLSANKTTYAFYFFNQIGLKTADSLGAGPIMFRNIYSFYTKNSSVFKAEGLGYTYSSIPLASNYSDEDEIYQFPLQYHDSDVSTFKFKFTIPGNLFSLVQSGTRVNYADGYGTVITPYKTYNNVLRLKTVINETDTLISSLAKIPIPRKTISYKYLSTSEKIPVLEITGNDQSGSFIITEIRYRDQYHATINPFRPTANYTVNKTTGIASKDTFTFTDVTANPPSTSRTWSFTPSTGASFVAGTSANTSPAKVVFSQSGTYGVKLNVTAITGTDDTTTSGLISIGVNSIRNLSRETALYPNPVKDHFILNEPGIEWVYIYDLSGKEVLNCAAVNGKAIDVNQLNRGVYLVKIKGKENYPDSKILIEK